MQITTQLKVTAEQVASIMQFEDWAEVINQTDKREIKVQRRPGLSGLPPTSTARRKNISRGDPVLLKDKKNDGESM